MSQVFHTKKDYVANRIREWLLEGTIRPGMQLRQRDLAEKLGTSITPVREALRQLESEGIVTHSPNLGVRVAATDHDAVEQIGSLRAVVEEQMVSFVSSSITTEHIERLRAIQADLEKAVDRRDWIEARKLNCEFHFAIYEPGASSGAIEILRYVWNKLRWQVLPASRMKESIREHCDLVAHLENGDVDQAKEAIRRHVLDWTETVTTEPADQEFE